MDWGMEGVGVSREPPLDPPLIDAFICLHARIQKVYSGGPGSKI